MPLGSSGNPGDLTVPEGPSAFGQSVGGPLVVVGPVGVGVVGVSVHSARQSACPASYNALKSAFEQHVHLVVV